MGNATMNQWKTVKKIMDTHDYPTIKQALKLMPFNDPTEMEKAMKMKLTFKTDHYRTGASGGHKEG